MSKVKTIGRVYILIPALLLIAAAVFIGIRYIAEFQRTPKGATEYQTVTIKELISSIDQYDGKNVLVGGKFTNRTGIGRRPLPMCMPTGTGLFPKIKESYKIYPSTWGVSSQDGIIGINVIDENGTRISTKPNYEEGQEIELRGMAKFATVADYCSRDIRYKSVYVEVSVRNVDIALKLSPKTLPENGPSRTKIENNLSIFKYAFSSEEAGNLKTYQNKNYGFELSYPRGKILNIEENTRFGKLYIYGLNLSTTAKDDPKRNSDVGLYTTMSVKIGPVEKFPERIDALKKIFLKNCSSFHKYEENKIILNNLEFLMIDICDIISGDSNNIYFASNGRYFYEFFIPLPGYDNNLFEKIISTFKLKNL